MYMSDVTVNALFVVKLTVEQESGRILYITSMVESQVNCPDDGD